MSLSLRAELEDWLAKIHALAQQSGLPDHTLTHENGFGLLTYLPFRWLFSVFCVMATLAFLVLLRERLAAYLNGG